ncbi:MAG: hypothetical protein IT430_12755 [Phycisphaerales bacterium]|nr:hypothetical protein [Phycisphaerales bacterium]
MHGRKNKTSRHRARPASSRRGSVLILVVGVLVLLAISAAVYVGVGQQERLAASASEMKSHRDAVAAKAVDYVGQIIAYDPFGGDPGARFPFEDLTDNLGFQKLYLGERWDYPYTRPGNSSQFNVLADPWLADLEPVDSDGDGIWDIWRHISNVHPQGRFVSLAGFFSGARGLGNNSGFYADLYIGGSNANPYRLDTYTNANRADPFDYSVQMGRQFLGEADDSIVTWADRMLGADTDGDGRIDARWTELPDVWGLPKEMRIFGAFRIVDASAMLNLNANFELGASSPDEFTDAVSLGRTPADVDLYTLLFDAFQDWGGPNNDDAFINGAMSGRPGFKKHLFDTGIQSGILGTQPYAPLKRSTREQREAFWTSYARNPYRPGGSFSPYGVADEMELRTFMFGINDRATSRLEQTFDGLNFDPADFRTWHSPLRNRFVSTERVDLYRGTPDLATLQDDARHLLTTYNGSRPVRPWNRGYAESDSPSSAINLNALLESNSVSTAQSLTGAFMWALAPYAVDVGMRDGSGNDSGYNLFNSPVVWTPTNPNEQLHYGDGDAGYAFYKSALLALNAIDSYDEDSAPTIRTLVMDRDYSIQGTDRQGKEIIGTFEHGKIPTTLPGPSGNQRGATITLMGLERQPFIREVSSVNVYGNIDDNEFWNYDPVEGDAGEWMVRILAIELGNPWPHPVKVSSGFKIKYGDDPLNSWTIPAGTPDIQPGEGVILYIAQDNPSGQANGVSDWVTAVSGRRGWTVQRIGDDSTHLEFSNGATDFDEVTLWRTASYGSPGTPVEVLIDRIRPATSNDDFPNIIPLSGELVSNPAHIPGESEFTVRVGSIRRYSDKGASGNSMPGYLFQSPVAIATSGRGSKDARQDDPFGGSNIPIGLIGAGLGSPGEFINDSSDSKGYAAAPIFAPFELIVGDLQGNTDETDENFRSSVDLLLLSSVGTIHCQQVPGIDPNFAEKHFYVTASELLGDESLRGRMVQELSNAGVANAAVLADIIRPATPTGGVVGYPADFRQHSNGAANRFVGRLDFTRFIPRSGNFAMPTCAVPLATRIIDAFDTVSVDSNVPLAQGRININTAPLRVLQALPFLHPRFAAGPIPDRTNNNLRIAESLRAYRDRGSFTMQSVDWSSAPRYEVSNLLVGGNNSGLRDDAASRGLAVNDRAPGFTSLGELLLATAWTPDSSGVSYQVDPGVQPGESAYWTGRDTGNLTYSPLNPNGLSVDATWEGSFDPSDDPTEHLALIRAIRNCVSTRSDVFIAYITLVGFTPGDIQRADAPGGSTVQKLTRLQASMEQRYVVVFDRSSVKSPSDRPRVLFAAQEVPSR